MKKKGKKYKSIAPELLIIDSFCGAGGVTEGFESAVIDGKKVAMVIVGINHDKKAIESHMANHPETLHFVEDMRTLDLGPVIKRLREMKKRYPNAKVVFHASLECTNFSKAKGGLPRNADSRTLAEHLFRYIEALNPDYITIENVVEFMAWGPLDENNKPVSRLNGRSWMRWRKKIRAYGYDDQWKEMNSANYGAFTSRNRLFGMFAKKGLPIVFPDATHAKDPGKKDMFTNLEKWKPVREVLELEDKGRSIFERTKPLSEKTLQRIYAGLVKFVAGGKDSFLAKTYAVASNHHGCTDTEVPMTNITPRTQPNLVQAEFISQFNSGSDESRNKSLDGPCNVVPTNNRFALVQPQFIMKYFSGRPAGKVISVEGPAGTITTSGGGQTLVSSEFISVYHGANKHCCSVDQPSNTIPTNDSMAIIQPQFIFRQFSGGQTNQSIEKPAGSMTSVPKMNLVSSEFLMRSDFNNKPSSVDEPAKTLTASRHHQYLVNPSWGGNPSSVDLPHPVIVARQDKAPMYLVTTDDGKAGILIYETDSEYTKKIKDFMALYGIVDIKMRMLKVQELKKIQGFPATYILKGTQTDQKKFIGNSVVPVMTKKWGECIVINLREYNKAA